MVSVMGYGLAGALQGAGQGLVEEAKAKRERALLTLQQDFTLKRDSEDRDFRRSERLGAQEFQGEQNKLQLEAAKIPKPTDDIREYEKALTEGYQGNFVDFQKEMKKAGASKTDINLGGNKFDEGMGKFQAEMFGTIYQDGLNAQGDAAMIERLDGLMRQFKSGGGAKIKQFAGEFGIDTSGLDEIQAAEAILSKMVPSQRTPGSGPMSDADLDLFKKSLPRIMNQPGGNALIIDSLRGISEYRILQGKVAERLMTGEITREQALKELSTVKNPLEEFNAALGKSGEDRSADIKKKYGLE